MCRMIETTNKREKPAKDAESDVSRRETRGECNRRTCHRGGTERDVSKTSTGESINSPLPG